MFYVSLYNLTGAVFNCHCFRSLASAQCCRKEWRGLVSQMELPRADGFPFFVLFLKKPFVYLLYSFLSFPPLKLLFLFEFFLTSAVIGDRSFCQCTAGLQLWSCKKLLRRENLRTSSWFWSCDLPYYFKILFIVFVYLNNKIAFWFFKIYLITYKSALVCCTRGACVNKAWVAWLADILQWSTKEISWSRS